MLDNFHLGKIAHEAGNHEMFRGPKCLPCGADQHRRIHGCWTDRQTIILHLAKAPTDIERSPYFPSVQAHHRHNSQDLNQRN